MSWLITGKSAALQLLDVYSGAAAAYSLRSLSLAYGGPVVRVRRSSDNAEQDFAANRITDGTLTTFCGANDGFVRTWYDQSGNSKHAVQSNQSSQPLLVSGGSVVLMGSKPALRFDGANDFLTTASLGRSLLANRLSMFIVYNSNSTSVLAPVAFQDTLNSGTPWLVPVIHHSGGTQTNSYFASIYTLFQSRPLSQPALFTFTHINGLYSKTINASNTVSATAASLNTGETMYVGNWFSGYISMTMPELIVYNADLATQQSQVEANINTHYSIY